MKKALFLCGIALFLCAAGLNARQNPVKPKAYKTDKVLSLDSIYLYYDSDSVLNSKIYNVLDPQTMTAKTSEYQPAGEDNEFMLVQDTVRYLDQKGVVTLMKVYTWDYDDKKMFLVDSVLYSYDNNVTYEMGYAFLADGSHEYTDSIIIKSNNNGLDTLAETWRLYPDSAEWVALYKEIWKYDSKGNVTYYDYFHSQTSEGAWIPDSRDEYFYDENGVDTLLLHYTANNQEHTLQLYSKKASTVNAAGKKDLMYQLMVHGSTDDTIFVDTFKYDAQNRLVATVIYSPKNQRVDTKGFYTYDQFGNVFTYSEYAYDGESGFAHVWTDAYFWSETIISGVEDVNEEKVEAREGVKVTKYMINGQLFIERNGVTYDAQGRVVRQ